LGLKPDIAASIPTTEGVIDALRAHELQGRHIAVQLYGDNPNQPLINFIEQAGGTAHSVAPYIYADDADSEIVATVIRELAAGNIDAIAFTSGPQIKRMQTVARQHALETEFANGMHKTLVAAVGPLVAEALQGAGFSVDLMPKESFFLKPLVNELAARLGPVTA
jgi:uroporphyrinogen-III synthase